MAGIQRNIFVPDKVFFNLVHNQTEKFRDPSRQCARHVHDELNNLINELPSPELQRFVNLKEHVVQVCRLIRGIVRVTQG